MPKKNTIKKSALTPTILVAGGAGFIGSHLCESLLNKGGRVVVLDNFNTGKEIHVNHLLQNSNFALFNTDINTGIPREIESVDYIFHFAGLEEYLYNKDLVNLESLLTNSFGTKNLLDLALRSDAKFMLASSIDVYEGRMSQLDIQSYFGKSSFDANKYSMTEAKRFAEALVWEYQKNNDVDVRIARLPEVYGPRMSLDSSGSLGGLMKNVIENKNLTIHGDGHEKEYYIYIEDALSGIIKTLFNKDTRNGIFSLVSREPKSVLEIAFLMKNLADRPLEIEYADPLEEPRPEPKVPDTFNLKEISWEPKITLKEGLKRTFEWFGYTANDNAFKPAKYIPLKKRQANEAVPETDLFSLQDIKNEEFQGDVPADDFVQVDTTPTTTTLVDTPDKFVEKEFDQPPVYKDEDKKEKGFEFNLLKNLSVPGIIKRMFRFILSPYSLLTFLILIPPLIIFLIYPGVTFYNNARASIASLQKISDHAYRLDSFNIAVEADNANQSLIRSRDALKKLSWAFTVTGKKEEYRSVEKLLSSLELFSKAGTYVSSALVPYEDLWEVIKPDTQDTISEQEFTEAKLAITNAQNFVELSYVDFNEVNRDDLPQKIAESLPKYEFFLDLAKEGLDIAEEVSGSLPQLLGSEEEKKYMIVFQNSNEIRPTGGFIGSYAIIDFDKGKISNLVIDDIYNPDGQIDIKEIDNDPPAPIRELLVEERLYIRNSNWDPDFERSAKQIKDLYEEVTNEEIHGVVAIDLFFVKKLLEVTDPIYLTSYNEEISSENLYERTQFHSEFNYKVGSDQKRSFLTVLGSKLLERFFGLQKEELPVLFEKLEESLSGRHLMFYFENSPIMNLISERKWDGKLVDVNGDYLNIVNSNLGGTKANYHVRNFYEYDVTSKTRDGLLRAELKLNYRHTGEDSSWPGGPYVNYVRVLTQRGTKLTGARVLLPEGVESVTYIPGSEDEEEDSPEEEDAEEVEEETEEEQKEGEENIVDRMIISNEGDYTSYEYVFKIEPQEEITIIIEYDLPERLSVSKERSDYEFYLQKQPGTVDDQFLFTFSLPFGMEIEEADSKLKWQNERLESGFSITEDAYYFIKLR